MSRSTLPLLVFAFATLFALGCSRDGGRALEDIRRWEDSRSIPPDSLDTLLREGDVRIRAAGVRAAGRVGDWANRDAVEDRLLKDDAPVVRAEAAFALGILGDPTAGPALARTLDREPDAEVVGEIVLAIGRLELREATPQLLPLLREGHAHVQEQCAEALALLADSTSVDALLVATESPLESVRWRAAYALEKMPRQIDQSQARLRELLSDTSSLVRRYAIRALGRTGYHAAMGDIATCLRANPNDWQLWSIGCDAIGRLDEAEATGILREALGHASFHVRTGALMAAGLRAERELLPELLDQCKDASVGVRAAAYDAVGSCLEGRATSELLVGLDDESTIVAAACARRLGECDDDRAMVTLLELIRDDEEPILRAAATDGLGRAGERAPIPVLRALSSDDDWVVATIAIDALGTLEINDAVPGLLAEFDRRDGDGRNDVCWQILQTLERIADPAAIPLCRRALESESDARLRLAAARSRRPWSCAATRSA